MTQSQTQRNLYAVLDAINRLSASESGRYINDTEIAQELDLDIQDVQDYLDILKDENKVKLFKTSDASKALLVAKGRIALKDPEHFLSELNVRTGATIGGSVLTEGGNFAGRDSYEFHYHFPQPSFSLYSENAQRVEEIRQTNPSEVTEDDKRRDIALRKRLRNELPLSSDYRMGTGMSPHLKYAFETVIIHSFTDDSYGKDGDFPPNEYGYSGWFKLDMWDTYHDGLELLVDIEYGLIDEIGRWMLLQRGQEYDADTYSKIKLYRIGRIPLRNIIEFDAEGDEYYAQPHFYCRFNDSDGPFSEYRWVIVDGDDSIDLSIPYYPMDSTKQVKAFPDQNNK